jgi:hypothetical protein
VGFGEVGRKREYIGGNMIKESIKKLKRRFELWKPIHLCWWFEKHGWKIPKYLIGNPGTEDLTGYTENDSISGLTLTGTNKLGVNFNRSSNTVLNLYKDFGADHFDKLDVLLEMSTGHSAGSTGNMGSMILASPASPNGFRQNGAASTDLLIKMTIDGSYGSTFSLSRGDLVQDDSPSLSNNTIYYMQLERAAGNDTATLKIYSDSGRTSLVDTLSISGFGTVKWRYLFAFANYYLPYSDTLQGVVQNIDLQEPVAPTVTTQAVSDKATTSGTGNGNITATGGANATRRGFCYKAGDSGDPTTADSVVYDDGDFGTGAFYKSITGLSAGTAYRVRAYAVNSVGTSYGSTVAYITSTAKTASLQYAIKSAPAAKTKALIYSIKTIPSAKEKALIYAVRSSITKTKGLQYAIKSAPAAKQKTLQYEIKTIPPAVTKIIKYTILTTPAATTKALEYRILFQTVGIQKGVQYAIKSVPSAKTKELKYTIKTVPATITKGLAYSIKQAPSAVTKGLIYLVKTTPSAQTKTLAYEIKTVPLATTKSLRYAIKATPAATTKAIQYEIKNVTVISIQKDLKYEVKSAVIKLKQVKYTVTTTPAAQIKALRYDIRKSSAITKGLRYAVKANHSIQKGMAYVVGVHTIAITKQLKYQIKTSKPAITKSMQYVMRIYPYTDKTSPYGKKSSPYKKLLKT